MLPHRQHLVYQIELPQISTTVFYPEKPLTSTESSIVIGQGPRRVFESGVAKKCFEPRSGEKYFLGPSRESGGMLPQKILKTKCLSLA